MVSGDRQGRSQDMVSGKEEPSAAPVGGTGRMSVNWGHAHPAVVPVKSVLSGVPRFCGSLSPLLPHKILAPA